MLNAVRSIKDMIKGAKQASKEMSSASGDDAESFSSESIDELQGKKQQDQIIKDLKAARAKLKEKIATYKKEQVRVTNELHEQHVLIAT
eukprot:m51a1_g11694 hypothetical protein (89) ;mRNA; f:8448-9405